MLEHLDRARRSRRTRPVAFVLAVVTLLAPLSAGGPAGAGPASAIRPDRGGPEPTIALVYVDAFIPDAGETAGELAVGSCVDPATAVDAVPIPGGAVDLYLRHDAAPPYPGYAACFANGVARRDAAVLFASQRPAALEQFSDPSGPPAWETIPSWSLIGTADRVIPPARQEAMSARAGARVTTVNAGHLSLVTRPHAVAEMIEEAADATT